jgi:hypothetical protein
VLRCCGCSRRGKASPRRRSSRCSFRCRKETAHDPFHWARNPQQGRPLFSNNKGISGSMKRIDGIIKC